jgi:hypothetical protein
MAISKVVYGGNTLIDLTADTVKAEHLIKGYTAHGADGEPITGANDWDSNTMSATAADSEILLSKTAYVKGAKKTGTMPNNGAVSGAISTKAGVYTVPKGYHDGSGKVQIASAEQAKLIPENVREGITLLGVVGTMSGTEDAIPQAKEVTPSTTEQEVLPDTGYNFLSSVTVKAIPYTETANSAGGMTVTIA